MSQYEHTATVNSSPEQVFDFVSNIDNLPRYLPTVKNAMSQGRERVRVQGEAGEHQYDSEGYYRVDKTRNRIEWGSDGENQYHGWLEVKADEGAAATVTVHLSFDPRPDIAENTTSRVETVIALSRKVWRRRCNQSRISVRARAEKLSRMPHDDNHSSHAFHTVVGKEMDPIIGLFDTPTQAEQAKSEIMALSSPSVDIQVYDKAGFQLTGGTDTSTRGFGESLSQTLGFGPSNQAMYQEGIQRGETVVSVRADESRTEEIATF